MAIYRGRKVSITRVNPGVDSVNITDVEGKGHTVNKDDLIYTDAEVQSMKKRDDEIAKDRQEHFVYRTVKTEQEKADKAKKAQENAAQRQAEQDKEDGIGLGL